MPQIMNNGCLTVVTAMTSQTIANPPQRRLNGTRNASAPVKRTLGSGCPTHSSRSSWCRIGRTRFRGSFMSRILAQPPTDKRGNTAETSRPKPPFAHSAPKPVAQRTLLRSVGDPSPHACKAVSLVSRSLWWGAPACRLGVLQGRSRANRNGRSGSERPRRLDEISVHGYIFFRKKK